MSRTRTAMRLPIVVALSLAAGPALACRCADPGDAPAYRDALAVVLARVIQVSGNAVGPGGAVAVLAVDGAWKSVVGERIEVATSTTCGYVFEAGKEYLVYLRTGDTRAPYTTRKCMGNRPLVEASERLNWLHRNGKPVAATTPAQDH